MLSPPYNKARACNLHQIAEISKATARRRQLLRQRCFPDSSVISWKYPELIPVSSQFIDKLLSKRTEWSLEGLAFLWSKQTNPDGLRLPHSYWPVKCNVPFTRSFPATSFFSCLYSSVKSSTCSTWSTLSAIKKKKKKTHQKSGQIK